MVVTPGRVNPGEKKKKNATETQVIAIGNAQQFWHSHIGRQFGSFLQSKTSSYHATQQLPSEVSTHI